MVKIKKYIAVTAGVLLLIVSTAFIAGCGESAAEKEQRIQKEKMEQFNKEFFKRTPMPKEKAAGMPDFK